MEIRFNPITTAGKVEYGNFKNAGITGEKAPEIPGDSVERSSRALSAGPEVAEEKIESSRADASQYYYKPDFPVVCENGKWVMHLPNANVPLPGRPQWMKTFDHLNAILDGSSDPGALREMADSIKGLADESYIKQGAGFKEEVFDEILGSAKREHVENLRDIFQLKLDDESKSTAQVGGTLAGTLCSEMNKYGKILSAIRRRMDSPG